MPNIRQEKFCRDEFDRWLKGRIQEPTSWEDEKNDPPDFWLTLGEVKYAVEVTRVLYEENKAVMASLTRLVDNTSVKEEEAGCLSGTYFVAFGGRINNMKRDRPRFQEWVHQYVRRTASVEKSRSERFEIDGTILCDIRKIHRRGAVILAGGSSSNTGLSENGIRVQLSQILQRQIADKAMTLTKIDHPKILVIYDLYALADEKLFAECVQAIPETKLFRTIYIVEDIGAGYPAFESHLFLAESGNREIEPCL